MAWSAYRTWVAGDVLTAAQLNQDIRDNGNLLLPAAATVATSETTTSTSYTDLTTSGPAVTLTTGTKALIVVGSYMNNNTTSAGCLMGFTVSGATTLAADDTRALILGRQMTATGSGFIQAASRLIYYASLTAGSNTFTSKYKVSSGTGTFADRFITVWPYNS